MILSRRKFLAQSVAAAGLMALRPDRVVKAGLMGHLFGKAGKKPVSLTPNDDFYVTSIGESPSVDVKQWGLSISGLVKHPITLTYEELLKRPQVSMVATLECIGNPLGGEQIGTARWAGIPLHELLEETTVDEKAVDLVLHGADGYSDSFPLNRTREKDVLLAITMNGTPLPLDHGFPARVIVPGLYGIKNVKWLTKLEVVAYDYRGYWQREGWPEDASVNVQSRIDLPGDRETIKTSAYTMEGIAFGGEHGIDTVEVSMDLGVTWLPAELAAPLSAHAWRLWSFRWQIPKPGEYTILVRATNGQGVIQGKRLGDWHGVSVEATF